MEYLEPDTTFSCYRGLNRSPLAIVDTGVLVRALSRTLRFLLLWVRPPPPLILSISFLPRSAVSFMPIIGLERHHGAENILPRKHKGDRSLITTGYLVTISSPARLMGTLCLHFQFSSLHATGDMRSNSLQNLGQAFSLHVHPLFPSFF